MSVFVRLGLILGCCLYLNAVSGQESTYYWSGDQKVQLTPNKSSLILYLGENQTAEAVFNLSHRALREVRDQERPAQSYWIADLAKSEFSHPMVAARSLTKPTVALEGASFGLRIAGGMPVWLSRKILLEPNASFDPAAIKTLLGGYGSPALQQAITGMSFIELPTPEQVIPLANALYETGMFAYAHPDFLVRSYAANGYPAPSDTCHTADTYYDFQYYLYSCCDTSHSDYPYSSNKEDLDIDAPEAWCITRGDAGVTIAVIDEGVQYHEDLLDTLDVSRLLPGYTPSDTNGIGAPEIISDAHGQAVTGIIAASHDNEGVAGVAPYVAILPIHVYTDGTSPVSHFTQAIDWAWQNGADVINNSWVFDTCGTNLLPALENAIIRARTLGRSGLGCPVVFSSGSIVSGNSCVGYPASIPEVLTVGVIDGRGNKPNYARFGTELDLVGISSPNSVANLTVMDLPGDSGYNYTGIPYDEHADINYSRWFGGTSATAAQASGILGLMLSRNMDLTELQLIDMLKASVDTMGGPTVYGEGRLNAYQAVLEVESTFPVEWLDVSAQLEGENVRIDWFTAQEQNNDFFQIERLNGSVFEALGKVAGAGNSSNVLGYSFIDDTPPSGTQAYRIRQVDIDGQFAFSPTVEVQVPVSATFSVFPNPVSDVLQVRFAAVAEKGKVTILDMSGREVISDWLSLETGAGQIDVEALPAGLYFVLLETLDLERAAFRVLVQ